jgi:hypothetical protein
LTPEKFSPLVPRPKKRVVSKGLAGMAGHRDSSLKRSSVLSLACFSEGWGLRGFSPQLMFCFISIR